MPTYVSDWKNAFTSVASLPAQVVRTATGTGTGVDCLLADGSIGVHYSVGAVTGSPTSLVLTVEESDSLSTGYSAIATTGSGEGTVDVTAGSLSGFLNLWHRSKRYVRVISTLVGGTNYYLTANVVYRKKMESSSPGNQL